MLIAQAVSSEVVTAANTPLYGAFLFYPLALLTCVSAWAIVLSQNIVRMAVYLLLTLGGAAGMYFMMEAEFLAAIQLIVYAGGTLILIIFGVMLTSKNPFMQLRVHSGEMYLGIALGLLVMAMLIFATVATGLGRFTGPVAGGGADYSQVVAIGKALMSKYLVAFELAAVLLLAVMIGAAFMARRRGDEPSGPADD